MKASPSVVLSACLLVWRWQRALPWWPGLSTVGKLALTGLIAQIAGNVLFQYSLGIIGIALSVPLTFGTLIGGGAVLGRVWLGEPISMRAAGAMLLLLVAIAVLSGGARAAEQVVESQPGEQPRAAKNDAKAATPTTTKASTDSPPRATWHVALGVLAACGSGLAYGLLGVALRAAVSRRSPLATTLFVISTVGMVSLGLCSLLRLGVSGVLQTNSVDFNYMAWAGVFNAVAFMALIQALKLAPVVHVNAVNSSQTALAAVAGILIFGEPLNWPLIIGVSLTMAGLLLLDHGPPAAAVD